MSVSINVSFSNKDNLISNLLEILKDADYCGQEPLTCSRLEKLNGLLNTASSEDAAGKKGKYILFTPEEREACKKRYIEFSEEESKIERIIRRDRKLAAAKPPVYLTI
jgi:hypothetical protein